MAIPIRAPRVPRIPRSTWAAGQLVSLVVVTGLFFGLVCIVVFGGAFVMVSNLGH